MYIPEVAPLISVCVAAVVVVYLGVSPAPLLGLCSVHGKDWLLVWSVYPTNLQTFLRYRNQDNMTISHSHCGSYSENKSYPHKLKIPLSTCLGGYRVLGGGYSGMGQCPSNSLQSMQDTGFCGH